MKSKNNMLNSCIIEHDIKKFSLNDKGTNNRVYVSVGDRKCQMIQIDGKLDSEITPTRCDWCIRDYQQKDGECLFVELKGSDLLHAIEQIGNTIRWFKENITPFKCFKHSYVVMKNTIPKVTTKRQNAESKFTKKYSSVIKSLHPENEITFS